MTQSSGSCRYIRFAKVREDQFSDQTMPSPDESTPAPHTPENSAYREQALTLRQRLAGVSNWLPWFLIAAGTWVRLAQYLANRSLWLDELFLALNIVNRSFSQLVQPLDHNQVAPIGFMMIERLAVQVLGNGEYALRLLPLVGGIASMFLFYAFARQHLGPWASVVGLALFCFSSPLVYYSSEVKPYSTDVLVLLLLFGLMPSLKWPSSVGGQVALGLCGAVAVWLSFPAVFVLLGIGGSLALPCLIRKQWSALGKPVIVYLLWGASVVAVYFVSLSPSGKNSVLSTFWQNSFMPFPPLSYSDLKWFINTFFATFDDPVGLTLMGLAAYAFLVGSASMAVEKNKLLVLISPIVLALVASGLHKYPFNGRLILFIVPILLLLIAKGVEQVASQASTARVGIVLTGLLLIHPLLATADILLQPQTIEETRPVIQYIQQHRQADDLVYVYYGALPAILY